jgi:hypothetical protein
MFIVHDKNLDLLKNDYGEDNCLSGISKWLEGGLIMVIGHSPEGIYLLANTIHTTYMITECILCGVTCATASAIVVFTHCVSQELARPDKKGTLEDKEGDMHVYNRSLECVFKQSQGELIDKAISAWICHQGVFLAHSDLLGGMKDLWFRNLFDDARICQCGHLSVDDSFMDYLKFAHLGALQRKRAQDNSSNHLKPGAKKQRV